MNTWFVSTVNRLPGEQQFSFIWSMEEFESEIAARRYAKDALNKGLRVEAGTLPEIGPEIWFCRAKPGLGRRHARQRHASPTDRPDHEQANKQTSHNKTLGRPEDVFGSGTDHAAARRSTWGGACRDRRSNSGSLNCFLR